MQADGAVQALGQAGEGGLFAKRPPSPAWPRAWTKKDVKEFCQKSRKAFLTKLFDIFS